MATERVTVTLPSHIVREIERLERNRSRFVLEAVRSELRRRQRQALRTSLEHPHPESEEMASMGLEEWMGSEGEELLDPAMGRDVRWVPGKGWQER